MVLGNSIRSIVLVIMAAVLLSACATKTVKKVDSGMIDVSHGSTFGGNPLAMSIANAVLDQIFKKGFLKHVKNISKYFHDELKKIKKNYPELIKEVN